MEFITPTNGRHFIVTSERINASSKKVFRDKTYLFYHEGTKLSKAERWESCFYNIEGKKTAIQGQVIPEGGFKPSETDDTYFENLEKIYSYKLQGKNFFDKTKAIHKLLQELP